mgnify:CR=1 FL=1
MIPTVSHQKSRGRSSRGFTLLEILLVVAAIAILAGIVIVAINPARQLAETRDAQRHSDVQTISSAITQYIIKNGALPEGLPTLAQATCDDVDARICRDGDVCEGGIELHDILVPDYVAALPEDPSSGISYTGYTAYKLPDPSSRVEVCAPYTEIGNPIYVTR